MLISHGHLWISPAGRYKQATKGDVSKNEAKNVPLSPQWGLSLTMTPDLACDHAFINPPPE